MLHALYESRRQFYGGLVTPCQTTMRNLFLALVLGFGASGGLGACGPAGPEPRTPADAGKAAAPPPTRASASPSRTEVVARVPVGTFGPRLFANAVGRVAVWAVPGQEQGGWYSLALPYDGRPGAALRLVEQDPQSDFFEVGEFGADGVFVASVRRSGQLSVIEGLEVAYDGTLRRGPEVLVETPAEVLWVSSAPTAEGAQLFWAEQTAAGADLYMQGVTLGRGLATPHRIAQGALAWQLKSSVQGAVLVSTEQRDDRRQVMLRRFATNGSVGQVQVSPDVEAAHDLDLVVVGEHAWVAYSEPAGYFSQLVAAKVDLQTLGSVDAVVPAPRPVTPPRGDQVLVRLLGPGPRGSRVVAVWEEPSSASLSGRQLFLSVLSGEGAQAAAAGETEARVQPEAELAMFGDEGVLPAFALGPEGLVVVSRSPLCPPGQDGVRPLTCSDAELAIVTAQATPQPAGWVPTAEVLYLSQLKQARASLAWDVTCTVRGCFALVATGSAPTTVALADLAEPRGAASPLRSLTELDEPRILQREIIAPVEPLADLSGAPSAGGTLVSWVSFFDPTAPYVRPSEPAPDGRLAPVRARLQTQFVAGEERAELVEQTVVSYRARSLGGVALSGASGPDGTRVLGWAALDGGSPQVFATRIDARGRKLSQRMLTHSPGEVTDVAVAALDDGYLVAWVDGRGDSAQLFALRLDLELRDVGSAKRLTQVADQPTGLALGVSGGRAVLVWSDARGTEVTGYADLFSLPIDLATLEPLTRERRLLTTADHSHSARLVKMPDQAGWLLLWLESGGQGVASRSILHAALLTQEGRFAEPARRLALPGQVRAYDAVCETSQCRIVATVDAGSRGEMWTVRLPAQGEAESAPLTVLDGPPLEAIAPVMSGNDVLYVDQDGSGSPLLRRLRIEY